MTAPWQASRCTFLAQNPEHFSKGTGKCKEADVVTLNERLAKANHELRFGRETEIKMIESSFHYRITNIAGILMLASMLFYMCCMIAEVRVQSRKIETLKKQPADGYYGGRQ